MSTPEDLRADAEEEIAGDRHDALHRDPDNPQPAGDCTYCDEEWCERCEAWIADDDNMAEHNAAAGPSHADRYPR